MADLDLRALEHLSRSDLLRMYRTMRLSRLCEERIITLFRGGELVGGVFTGIGMEGIAIGFGYAMGPDDVFANMHRETGALLLRGLGLKEYFCQWMGRANGIMRGRDGNMHFGDPKRGWLGLVSHIGTSAALAAGAALSFKLRRQPRVAWAPHGDGATSTGYWHESLNFAAVQRLPVVFVCINNQWAISTPLSLQMAVGDIASRADAYGLPGLLVDGNDVLAVYEACRAARERAVAGEGPTLIECRTYRVRGHSEADRAEYLPPDEVEAWKGKDPLARLRTQLLAMGMLSDADVTAIDRDLTAAIDEAVDFARSSPLPDPATLAEGLYAREVG
jgi:TPP-dependent pyruvate/acetoin dehydrogenase alpha subunit